MLNLNRIMLTMLQLKSK